MAVAIAIPKPLGPQNEASATSTGPLDRDNVAHDEGTTPHPPEGTTPVEGPPAPHGSQKTGTATTKASPTANQQQKETDKTTSNATPTTPAEPEEPQTGKQIAVRTLRQQPEIVIRSWIGGRHSVQSHALEAGDILELDGKEGLYMKAGGIALIVMRYAVEKFVEVVENQDGGK